MIFGENAFRLEIRRCYSMYKRGLISRLDYMIKLDHLNMKLSLYPISNKRLLRAEIIQFRHKF